MTDRRKLTEGGLVVRMYCKLFVFVALIALACPIAFAANSSQKGTDAIADTAANASAGNLAASGQADQGGLPFLSPLFSDNMVLQRDTCDPVWGWTTPGAVVTVRFAGRSVTGVADPDGKWTVDVGPLPAGGPYTMDISGPQNVHLSNIMMGDVWICSGQSNMEVSVSMMKNGPQEVANASRPDIRLFLVERAWGATPQQTLKHGECWKVCSPETITQGGWNGFSAVAYYYGRALQEKLNIPIGLVQTCWSATKAEAWTDAPTLATQPDFADVYDRLASLNGLGGRVAEEQEQWCDAHDRASNECSAPAYSDNRWSMVDLPGDWGDYRSLRDYTGIVWLRRKFHLAAAALGGDAVLQLGPIAEADTVWVNGVRVGFGSGRNDSRVYTVPADVLVAGKNTIAIRVLNLDEEAGGFLGAPGAMHLDTGSGQVIALAGGWRYKQTDNINKLSVGRPVWGAERQASQVPAALYNAMVAPLIPYAFTGVIWYQGESNTPNPAEYRTLLPALIADWRKNWGEGDFPFYIVQISSYHDTDPRRMGRWAAVREAQAQTAATIPNSGLAVTVDIGAYSTIHPPDKQDVGYRLARLALADYYHQNLVCSGPVFKAMALEGNGARLLFDHMDGGLLVTGGKLTGFEIAGSDERFYPADAQVQGNTVFVSSRRVKYPAAVRYGWADYPACDLYNGAGLPAVPFRTDDE